MVETLQAICYICHPINSIKAPMEQNISTSLDLINVVHASKKLQNTLYSNFKYVDE